VRTATCEVAALAKLYVYSLEYDYIEDSFGTETIQMDRDHSL